MNLTGMAALSEAALQQGCGFAPQLFLRHLSSCRHLSPPPPLILSAFPASLRPLHVTDTRERHVHKHKVCPVAKDNWPSPLPINSSSGINPACHHGRCSLINPACHHRRSSLVNPACHHERCSPIMLNSAVLDSRMARDRLQLQSHDPLSILWTLLQTKLFREPLRQVHHRRPGPIEWSGTELETDSLQSQSHDSLLILPTRYESWPVTDQRLNPSVHILSDEVMSPNSCSSIWKSCDLMKATPTTSNPQTSPELPEDRPSPAQLSVILLKLREEVSLIAIHLLNVTFPYISFSISSFQSSSVVTTVMICTL